MSIVRDNLLSRPGYTPYCGAHHCRLRWPRTFFDGEQFKCGCGWRSGFEAEFIERYKRFSGLLAAVKDIDDRPHDAEAARIIDAQDKP